jgi:hypothetical protein
MGQKHQPGCPCSGCTNNTCCLLKCRPCSIPQKNLTLTWTNAITGTGSVTLVYANGQWASGCSNGLQYILLCNGGQIELRVTYWISGGCPGPGQSQYCSDLRGAPFQLTLASATCSPLSLTFTLTSSSCPAIATAGYTQFVVTDSSPVMNPPGLMCQSFGIIGCGNDSSCSGFVAGATVSVYSGNGGTLLASGTTGPGGAIYLFWQGAAGSYYITVTAPCYPNFGATLKLKCSGVTSLNIVPAGYGCCCGFLVPVPVTSYLTVCGVTVTVTATLAPGSNHILGFSVPTLFLPSDDIAGNYDPDPCQYTGTASGNTPVGISLSCTSPTTATMVIGVSIVTITPGEGCLACLGTETALFPGGGAVICETTNIGACMGAQMTQACVQQITLNGQACAPFNFTGTFPGSIPDGVTGCCGLEPLLAMPPMPCAGADVTWTS